jgi:hypothetical protein
MPLFPLSRHHNPSDATASAPPRRWGLWAAVLAGVVVLHLAAAHWVERHKHVSNPLPDEHVPVQIALLTPKPVEQAPAPSHPAAPARPIAPKVVKPAGQAQVLSITRETADAQAAAALAASEAAATQAAALAAQAQAQAHAAAAAKAAAPGDKFDVPPTGNLNYDTLVNGVTNQGGTIHWNNDGQHYDMIVSIPLPFVGPYVYSSKGHIDRFGIAPEQYSQQRGRHPADITIFNRETKQLVYTRTPNNQPLTDGAQDRFSFVMQLASLVRGAPDTYKPGVTRQFNVADTDSTEIWPIETIGDETVQTRGGSIVARHFKRLARHEGDRRHLDVWLAPSLGWLPVRVLQTEPNGMEIEMLWRGKLQTPAPVSSSNSASPDQSDSTDPGTPNASNDLAPAALEREKP